MSAAESMSEELLRLVEEYHSSPPIAAGSVKEEAWNLIADFAVEHAWTIAAALDAMCECVPTSSKLVHCGTQDEHEG